VCHGFRWMPYTVNGTGNPAEGLMQDA
jgi:hypothetical protein